VRDKKAAERLVRRLLKKRLTVAVVYDSKDLQNDVVKKADVVVLVLESD